MADESQQGPLSDERIAHLVATHWGERVCTVEQHPGYMNDLAILSTDHGRRVLRVHGRAMGLSRDPRTAGRRIAAAQERISLGQAMARMLAAEGLPVVTALPTCHGETIVQEDGLLLSFSSYAEGAPDDPYDPANIRAAAGLLARLHRASRGWQRCKRWPGRTAPAAWLTVAANIIATIQAQGAWQRCPCVGPFELSLLCQETVAAGRLGHLAVPDEALLVIHGDFRAANVLFAKPGKVSALLDFDFAQPGSMLLDLGYALAFYPAVLGHRPFCPNERALFLTHYADTLGGEPAWWPDVPAGERIALMRGIILWLRMGCLEGLCARVSPWVSAWLPSALERPPEPTEA